MCWSISIFSNHTSEGNCHRHPLNIIKEQITKLGVHNFDILIVDLTQLSYHYIKYSYEVYLSRLPRSQSCLKRGALLKPQYDGYFLEWMFETSKPHAFIFHGYTKMNSNPEIVWLIPTDKFKYNGCRFQYQKNQVLEPH